MTTNHQTKKNKCQMTTNPKGRQIPKDNIPKEYQPRKNIKPQMAASRRHQTYIYIYTHNVIYIYIYICISLSLSLSLSLYTYIYIYNSTKEKTPRRGRPKACSGWRPPSPPKIYVATIRIILVCYVLHP